MAPPPLPAFSGAPVVAAATRNVAATKRPAKHANTVVLRPASSRRVRSTQSGKRPPTRRVARPLQPAPQPVPGHAAPAPRRECYAPDQREDGGEKTTSGKGAAMEKTATRRKIGVEQVGEGYEEDVNSFGEISGTESVGLARGVKGSAFAVLEKKEAKLRGLAENEQRSQEEARRSFLDEQLAQRQAELEAKKAKRKPSKRVRPSSIIARKKASVPLKDTFKAYMDEISRAELLGQSQVIDLATQIRHGVQVEEAQQKMEIHLGRRPSIPELAEKLQLDAGDVQRRRMAGTAAKNALVAANLRLVTSVARKVASTKGDSTAGIALDDMVQEGSVGLIRAAEKFDASKGYKFSTYATWWIRAYVMRSITTQSRSIKVPSTIVDEYARIRKQYNSLRERGIFKPTDDQVAEALGITPAKLRFVINVVTQTPASLDIKLHSGDSTNPRSLGEIVESDDNIQERMVEDLQRKELDVALRNCLRPLERAVIRLRFGLEDGQPRTLRETGELLGLSKERVRQLVFRALPKMKTPEIQRMLMDAATR